MDPFKLPNHPATLPDLNKVRLNPATLRWEIYETRINSHASDPYAVLQAAYKERDQAVGTLRALVLQGGYTNYFMRDGATGQRFRPEDVL